MSASSRPAPPRETALALLAALARSSVGLDSRALRKRTREELRRRAFGNRRRGDTDARIRRRLEATGAIARRADGRWVVTPRGRWMAADPDSWMPGDVLPVTESEMAALRGYERLNAWATVVTLLSFVAFLLDGHHLAGTAVWHTHMLNVSARLDAFLRVVVTFGVGLIVPLLVLLASERGSDWIALVTRRYRRAKIVADPGRDR